MDLLYADTTGGKLLLMVIAIAMFVAVMALILFAVERIPGRRVGWLLPPLPALHCWVFPLG